MNPIYYDNNWILEIPKLGKKKGSIEEGVREENNCQLRWILTKAKWITETENTSES